MMLTGKHSVDLNSSIGVCAHYFDDLAFKADNLAFVAFYFKLSNSLGKSFVVVLPGVFSVLAVVLDCALPVLEQVLCSETVQLGDGFLYKGSVQLI